MRIIIPLPTKKALKKHGWEQILKTPVYKKKVGNTTVCVRLPYYELPYDCWVINSEKVTIRDLNEIAYELKKLEEN